MMNHLLVVNIVKCFLPASVNDRVIVLCLEVSLLTDCTAPSGFVLEGVASFEISASVLS